MSLISGKEAFVQCLISEGVEYVFGLPGSTETYLMDALEDHPEIKFILGLHESIISAVAVGYTRASGKVGVLNLHTSPGLSAAMPTLLDARRGGVPLIVTAGQSDNHNLLMETGLSGDLVGLGRLFAKWSTEVTFASDLALTMRRAFKVALQPPTGPVFVSLPQNILNENIEFDYVPNAPNSLSRRCPDTSSIDRVVDLLITAQNPAITVGNIVARYQAMPEVVELAELIGACVYPSSTSDISFPTNHRQYLAELPGRGQKVQQKYDVVIGIGTPPGPANKTIQLDNDPWEIGKNSPVTAGIEGDIKLSVALLNKALKRIMTDDYHKAAQNRANKMATEKVALIDKYFKDAEKEANRVPIAASRLMMEIGKARPNNAVIVDESWSYSTIMQRFINFSEPNSFFKGRGPSIGQGLPLSIGVKLALPERQVIAVVGDGSAMWSIQSLWTASH
ncbi:MAG: thiamine pyrophosphate-binding protein, partial [Chloroflexi bacterium]|nr:thiamine pyrophosphate-binding protein [Chloroflexota bacterium]